MEVFEERWNRHNLIEDIHPQEQGDVVDVRSPGTRFRSIGSLDDEYLHSRSLRTSYYTPQPLSQTSVYTRVPPIALLDSMIVFNSESAFTAFKASGIRIGHFLRAAALASAVFVTNQFMVTRWTIKRITSSVFQRTTATLTALGSFIALLFTPRLWFSKKYAIDNPTYKRTVTWGKWATVLLVLLVIAAFTPVSLVENNKAAVSTFPVESHRTSNASRPTTVRSSVGKTQASSSLPVTAAVNENSDVTSNGSGATSSTPPLTTSSSPPATESSTSPDSTTSSSPTSSSSSSSSSGSGSLLPATVTIPGVNLQIAGKQIISTSGQTITLN